MRRRRAILYDDDPHVLDALSEYFEGRGYDVLAFRAPVPCAIYEETALCGSGRPCADLLITDLAMPGMNGIELLRTQTQRGCPLTVENKAVISGSLDAAALEAVRQLGCASFRKPFRLAQLEAWIVQCESRMDLTRQLGTKRREPRETCTVAPVTVRLDGDEYHAALVNRSLSGMCLRTERELPAEQRLDVQACASSPKHVVVRWTKAHHAGGFLAGACCI